MYTKEYIGLFQTCHHDYNLIHYKYLGHTHKTHALHIHTLKHKFKNKIKIKFRRIVNCVRIRKEKKRKALKCVCMNDIRKQTNKPKSAPIKNRVT